MLLMRDGVQPRGENYQWDSTKGQMAPEGARLLCRALRPTAEIPHILASGHQRLNVDQRSAHLEIESCVQSFLFSLIRLGTSRFCPVDFPIKSFRWWSASPRGPSCSYASCAVSDPTGGAEWPTGLRGPPCPCALCAVTDPVGGAGLPSS